MKRLLLSVGLAVCPTLAVTQQPTTANLSLADALALARAHNPLYRQALHDRSPAGWAARNAWSSTFLPTLTASGGIGYSGSGQQRFLTANFSQNVSTLSSSYGLFLDWALNGQTLTQIPLKHAQLSAADADVAGAESNLITGVTQQYLSVLQARDNADVARKELDRNEQFLKLAQARYDVGRASLIDVRQAQVARGQAEVALLRAETGLQLEKLRLFQQIGVTPPVDVATVQLTDTFAVQTPAWQLGDLLTMAEGQNPALKALRAREGAASWGVRAATGAYTPSVAVSASWSGFTQKLSDIGPTIAGVRFGAQQDSIACEYHNTAWLNAGQTALPCGANTTLQEQAIRDQNSAYPFHFTPQPFQARLTISIRKPGVPHRHDRLPHDRDPRHEPHGGPRAAAARHRALPGRLGHVFRATGRPSGAAAGGERLCERRLRLSQGGRRARSSGGAAAAVTRGRDRHVQA
ncbi:MAG: hypothetical protein DMD52_01925 [Gemmatimonadetes bacterium]|nr:MAG: hypothetical protein DMD52_01925 [Gemmatimonadota bacterium]